MTKFKKRIKFLKKYAKFDMWLKNIGFIQINSDLPECYKIDIGKCIRFLRDRNKHKFMFVYSFINIKTIAY